MIEHSKNTIIYHFNINSIRSKYDTLVEIVKAFDIFFISESKLINTFHINQFSVRGYNFLRRDHNRFRGSLILCINENIPCRPSTDLFSDLELMAFEPHLTKRKWLLLGICKLHSQNDIELLNGISSVMAYYLRTYETFWQ